MALLYGVVSPVPGRVCGRIFGGSRISDSTAFGGLLLGVVSPSFDLVPVDSFVSDGSSFRRADRMAYVAKKKTTVFDLFVLDGFSVTPLTD